MQLPIEERAGNQVAAKPGARPRLDATLELVLGKSLHRHRHKEYLSGLDIKPHLNSKHRDQQHYIQVFDLAQKLGVGHVKGVYPGSRSQPFRLKLTLSDLPADVRAQLGLEADVGDLLPLPILPMDGGAKRKAAAKAASRPLDAEPARSPAKARRSPRKADKPAPGNRAHCR